jgi:hypothetical protein
MERLENLPNFIVSSRFAPIQDVVAMLLSDYGDTTSSYFTALVHLTG